jgi:tetratricopeptide (TPR) repeat protein
LGNRRGAIVEIERAVTIDPSRADAHLNLALLYDREGEKDRMREHLQEYLLCEPDGRWAQFARSKLPSEPAIAASRAANERAVATLGGARNKVTPFRRRS